MLPSGFDDGFGVIPNVPRCFTPRAQKNRLFREKRIDPRSCSFENGINGCGKFRPREFARFMASDSTEELGVEDPQTCLRRRRLVERLYSRQAKQQSYLKTL